MAPYFITSLYPRKEKGHDRPLIQVLREVTWLQYALVFSGYVTELCVIFVV